MTEQNILSELTSFMEAGEHTKFQLLQSWQEYVFTRKVRRAIKTLIKSLRVSAKKQLKHYCKDVIGGKSDFNRLLAYNYINNILNFYLGELKIAEEMLDEYEQYLAAGNWINFLWHGTTRPQSDLWDHRGL